MKIRTRRRARAGRLLRRPLLLAAVCMAGLGTVPASAPGAGLNTDVALSPPEGGTIVRVQLRYSELSGDATALDRTVRLSAQPVTVVHGVTADFSVLGTLPIVHRRVSVGATGEGSRDTGIGDIPLLAKYRFHQHDEAGRTTRWAAVGGAEIPSFDRPFSSESVDPIIGTVWTHQRHDWWLDWDLSHKFNTGGGVNRHDQVRGNTALSYRLLGGQHEEIGPWGFYAIGEINASYWTDGSRQVFASPGLQLITPRWIIEAGVQLPVHQRMRAPRLETDYTTVLSARFQF